MFRVKLTKVGGKFGAEVLGRISPGETQPPVRPFPRRKRPGSQAADESRLAMAANATILSTHLGLDIGGATIVADVSLEVRGKFVGIIGPNGAGKTSLFNLLSGLYRPTAGRIELDGRDITHEPPYRRTQEGLGRTFQISSVFPRLQQSSRDSRPRPGWAAR